MKRRTLVKIHLLATATVTLTIIVFLISSLIVEINGNHDQIKEVKKAIFYSLPIMILFMPVLGLSGIKLAGTSNNKLISIKKANMKWIAVNGMMLVALATFLYFRSNFAEIDNTFFIAQFLEFGFGLANLVLIGLNTTNGLKLTGKLKKVKI